MRAKTGEYKIHFYDRYGQRLKALETVEHSLLSSIEAGDQIKDREDEVSSYSVDRVIFNSLDQEG